MKNQKIQHVSGTMLTPRKKFTKPHEERPLQKGVIETMNESNSMKEQIMRFFSILISINMLNRERERIKTGLAGDRERRQESAGEKETAGKSIHRWDLFNRVTAGARRENGFELARERERERFLRGEKNWGSPLLPQLFP
jgi:hypothetical protein